MSYLVHLSFDIEGAEPEVYQDVKEALEDIGLQSYVVGKSGKELSLPANTYSGEYRGENSEKVREDTSRMVKEIFSNRNLVARIFLSVGGDWAWSLRNTS